MKTAQMAIRRANHSQSWNATRGCGPSAMGSSVVSFFLASRNRARHSSRFGARSGIVPAGFGSLDTRSTMFDMTRRAAPSSTQISASGRVVTTSDPRPNGIRPSVAPTQAPSASIETHQRSAGGIPIIVYLGLRSLSGSPRIPRIVVPSKAGCSVSAMMESPHSTRPSPGIAPNANNGLPRASQRIGAPCRRRARSRARRSPRGSAPRLATNPPRGRRRPRFGCGREKSGFSWVNG